MGWLRFEKKRPIFNITLLFIIIYEELAFIFADRG
jgi:hypothetical protein